MKTVNLLISKDGLQFSKEDVDKDITEIVSIVINNIILAYANQKQGLAEDERRKYYKIADCLEQAIKDKKECVDLEDDWYSFLQKCKKETNLMPSELLKRVEEVIDSVGK